MFFFILIDVKTMGLDMYLYIKVYTYPHTLEGLSGDLAEKFHRNITLAMSAMLDLYNANVNIVKDISMTSVNFQIGYWREAIAIHNWFVENVQDGIDDCKEYSVDSEDLKRLRDICKNLLLIYEEIPDEFEYEAETTLPLCIIRNDYDEDYVENLRNTIKIIDIALSIDKPFSDFIYLSSW